MVGVGGRSGGAFVHVIKDPSTDVAQAVTPADDVVLNAMKPTPHASDAPKPRSPAKAIPET
jgi:hypothetical protein